MLYGCSADIAGSVITVGRHGVWGGFGKWCGLSRLKYGDRVEMMGMEVVWIIIWWCNMPKGSVEVC